MPANRQIVLGSRPEGQVSISNFSVVVADTPLPDDGQVLIRNHYLSIEAWWRTLLRVDPIYNELFPTLEVGTVMPGITVGEVLESRHPDYAPGDVVSAAGGWQDVAVLEAAAPASLLMKVVPLEGTPLSVFAGTLGLTGFSAWYGVTQVLKPVAEETVVVSAACGGVGNVAGQLAKALGCRVVGIAGGAHKCRCVVEELGYDTCIDYKAHSTADSLAAVIRQAAPDGVDCYFDNVGGLVLDAVMRVMKPFGRVALCGMVADYEREAQPMGLPVLMVTKRLRVVGFSIFDHLQLRAVALAELGELLAAGKLKSWETVAEGLEAAPAAFAGLFSGENVGKMVLKLA